ncbi:MAG: carbonic anhydrase [Pseudobdellovibrionaceae bacterium]
MKILITLLAGLSLASCSSKQVSSKPVTVAQAAQSPAGTEALKTQAEKEKATLNEVPLATKTPPATTKADSATTKADSATAKTAPTTEKVAPVMVKAGTLKSSHLHRRGPVSSDKALGWLKNGNIRFTKRFLRKDGDSAKDRARLVSGQSPHSIVLSCSDSQVPPEIVFDQKLGEIYVIRTAGESLDASTLASIEYALEHLGSNLIVILGHESCGAVKAALATLGGADAGSPWLNKLMQDLHPHLKSFAGQTLSEGGLIEGWANTEGVAKDLIERSQIVRDALNTGEVKIQTALYHLGSGVVEFK